MNKSTFDPGLASPGGKISIATEPPSTFAASSGSVLDEMGKNIRQLCSITTHRGNVVANIGLQTNACLIANFRRLIRPESAKLAYGYGSLFASSAATGSEHFLVQIGSNLGRVLHLLSAVTYLATDVVIIEDKARKSLG